MDATDVDERGLDVVGADPFGLVVETKLAVPTVRHRLVDRPRVRGALDAGREASLILVAAPAGYGKTTAVRTWCSEVDAAVAWVTLDAGDNDPALLWRYVATAVDRVRPGLGRGALRRLGVAGSPIEVVVDEIMNGAAAFGSALAVVLDDLQTVTSKESLSSIDYALAHVAANVRVVLLTRVDPAIRLARLRAAGGLTELRAADLAFTATEANELLTVLGDLELGAEEVDLLIDRTEGWPAALILAWLWLRTVDDPVQAVRTFGGDQRFVADYLSSEVLGALDEDDRAFVHAAAVLGEFTADLCDTVLDRTDSAARLADLEHSILFISRLDRGGWFRIHSLFAEYARQQLVSLEPGEPTRIHRQAAEWLTSRGLPLEALVHAAACGDRDLVTRLLVDYHLRLIRGGAVQALVGWVRTLPDDHIVEHPELAVAAATGAMLVGGGTIEQRRFLRLADESRNGPRRRTDSYVETAALLVRAVTIDGGVRQAVLDGRRAVELAEVGSDEILTGALTAYSRALYFADELDEAWAVGMRALEHPGIRRHVPSLVIARSTLALVAIERGRVASARGHAEQARQAVGRIGSSRSWLGANASAALGSVLAVEGSLVEAEHELASAERFFRDEVATIHHMWVLVLLAGVRGRRGRLAAAEKALRSANSALRELLDSGRLPALVHQVERELETAKGRASHGEVLDTPSVAELAVLRLLMTDLTTREIGERLFVSANTVRSHRRSLYHKLDVHTRTDAVARATALGLLERSQSPR